MGRQWNQIIESLGPLTGGTVSINANLGDIDALLTTLQADVADGISVTSGTVEVNTGSIGIDGTPFSGANGSILSQSVQVGFFDVNNDSLVKVSQQNPIPVDVTTGTINNKVRGTTTIGTLTAVTTNGTLFATNSTRNYLLIQCTSGTAYLDTNGTATTSDGILLTSGQGITFEGSFVPTGAIAAITSTGTARLIGRQG